MWKLTPDRPDQVYTYLLTPSTIVSGANGWRSKRAHNFYAAIEQCSQEDACLTTAWNQLVHYNHMKRHVDKPILDDNMWGARLLKDDELPDPPGADETPR